MNKKNNSAKPKEEEVVEEVEEIEEEVPIEGEFEMAIVRMPSPTLADGLSRSGLGRPDYAVFLQQHLSYTAVLRELELKIIKLPSLAEFPDAHFVEDVAVLTPEVAVITRPGAEERRGEIEHIRDVLAEHRPLAAIEEPGTLDGGDVLQIDRTVYIGQSERTNEEGARQLAEILGGFGYETHIVPLVEGLHLKSSVNYIGRDTLLVTDAWADHPLFEKYEKIVVAPDETYAANSLLVMDRVLTPMGFPETQARMREAGFELLEISASEMQKVDGGMTCMSLRL
jgi:dimethylargininase